MTARRLLLAILALALVAAACKPIPYDFTGDHKGDLWWVDDAGWHDAVTGTTVPRLADPLTESGQPAAGDYDGDGTWEPAEVIADATTWEPTGEWRTAGTAGSLWLTPPACDEPPWAGDQHDQPRLVPLVGDWDGDRTSDPGWFCAVTATWVLEGRAPFVFGRPWSEDRHPYDVDIPAPADHDGDKRTDPVLYRPADGTWWAEGHPEPLLQTDGWGTPLAADLTTAPGDELVLWSATTGTWDVDGTPFSPSGSFPDPARVLPMPLDTDGDHRAERVVLGEVGGVWTFVGQDGTPLATGPTTAAYPGAAALPAAATRHIVLATFIEASCTGSLPPAGCPRPVPFDLHAESGADPSWIETTGPMT